MKRFIKAFTLIIALAVITLALVSCSVGSEAASLYKKAVKNMDKLDSFTANSVAELEAYSGRQKISTTVNTLTEVAQLDGELEFYRKATTKTKYDDDASSSTVTEGYFDGIAYYVYNENGYSTKLKSELTSARYAEYITSTSDTVAPYLRLTRSMAASLPSALSSLALGSPSPMSDKAAALAAMSSSSYFTSASLAASFSASGIASEIDSSAPDALSVR